jgi:hypothetical protein
MVIQKQSVVWDWLYIRPNEQKQFKIKKILTTTSNCAKFANGQMQNIPSFGGAWGGFYLIKYEKQKNNIWNYSRHSQLF